METAQTFSEFADALASPEGQQLIESTRLSRVADAARSLASASTDAMALSSTDDDARGSSLASYSDALADFGVIAHDDVGQPVARFPAALVPLVYSAAAVVWAGVSPSVCSHW